MSIRLSARLIVVASERSCRAGLYGYQSGCLTILMGHLHENATDVQACRPFELALSSSQQIPRIALAKSYS